MGEARPDRSAVLREIAEIERYLVDVPPHSGGGHRDALVARLSELRRELAGLDTAADGT